MTKKTTSILLLLFLSCFGLQVHAQEMDGRLGVGARVSYVLLPDLCSGSEKSCDERTFGVTPYVRFLANENFSFALSYTFTGSLDTEQHDGEKDSSSLQSLGAMVEYRQHLTTDGYLFAGVGVENWRSTNEFSHLPGRGSSGVSKDDGTNAAVGVGFGSGMLRLGWEVMIAKEDQRSDMHSFYAGFELLQ